VTRDYVYAGSRLLAAIEKPWADTSAVYDYIIPDGPAVTVSLGAANMEGYLVFDGEAGQRMSLYGSNSTITNVTGCNVWVTVWKPDNSKLSPNPDPCFDGTGWSSPHAGFLEPMTLPVTGTYLIKIDPNLTASGSLTLNLYTVPPDVTVPITVGGAAGTVSLIKPGHNGILTFDAVAGQRVALKGTSNSIDGHMWLGCDVWVTIRRPNLAPAHTPSACMGGLGAVPFVDAITLPDPGTYSILVNPDTIAMGSLTLTLYSVPADLSGTITPNGPTVPVTLSAPGQNASYTFTGTMGQRVAIGAIGSFSGHVSAGCDANVILLRPNLSPVINGTLCVEDGGFLEPVALPEDGMYTVRVNPETAATGSVTLALYTVPADGTGSLTVNASPVSVGLSPGQNATYTFSGTSGQSITVRLTGNTMGSVMVQLKRPNGSLQASKTSSLAAFNLSTVTLSATGTHSVLIDPSGANSGTISVQVTNP
jgi:hypothetical protein